MSELKEQKRRVKYCQKYLHDWGMKKEHYDLKQILDFDFRIPQTFLSSFLYLKNLNSFVLVACLSEEPIVLKLYLLLVVLIELGQREPIINTFTVIPKIWVISKWLTELAWLIILL